MTRLEWISIGVLLLLALIAWLLLAVLDRLSPTPTPPSPVRLVDVQHPPSWNSESQRRRNIRNSK